MRASRTFRLPRPSPALARCARALVLVASLGATSCTSGDQQPDAGTDAGTELPDAAVPPDAALVTKVTYVADVQPILRAKCAACHGTGQPMPAAFPMFAESYAETQKPSTRCSGDSIGTCIGLAVENQVVEGAGCRTIVVRPFHREGWICLTEAERAKIAAWVAGGMPEK